MTHFEKENFEKKHELHHEHHAEHHAEHLGGASEPSEKKAKLKFNPWKVASGVMLAILIVLTWNSFFSGSKLSAEEAGTKTLAFVNSELLQGQAVAKLVEVKEENGMYNVILSLSGKEINSYITKDGKLFFPQGINVDEVSGLTDSSADAAASEEAVQDLVKADKPKVELFVMSHCPYGTQAEKGMIPVAELLKDKISFEVKFVDYAMHGKKELDEQLRQYCIQKEQKAKFLTYLKCFLEKGESTTCMSGIDSAKLDKCIAATDKEFKVTELFNDQSSWNGGQFPQFNIYKTENGLYGVQGSPGLVLNGKMVNSGRSPAEYLKLVCASFSTAPAECGQKLSAETYQPGFGYTAGASTAASCGS